MGRNSVRRYFPHVGLAITLACILAPGINASSFSVSIPTGAIFASPVPVALVSGNSSARASNGSVGARTIATAQAPSVLAGAQTTANASAFAFFDDLIFTGPGQFVAFDGFQIPYAGTLGYDVNLLMDASGKTSFSAARINVTLAAAVTCQGCNFNLNGVADVTVTSNAAPVISRAQQTNPNLHLDYLTELPITAFFIGQPYAGVNVSVGYGLDGVFDTGPVLVPTGVPVSISMTIVGSAVASALFISDAVADFDFSHTLGLPEGVPVFNLPPGFTANSVSMGLVNNIIGEPIGGDSGDVPEPGTFGLVAAACVFLGCLRRSKTAIPRGRGSGSDTARHGQSSTSG
ncbi:MAG: hypothetical protein ABI972_23155 [Acidobacteriota bacterium]